MLPNVLAAVEAPHLDWLTGVPITRVLGTSTSASPPTGGSVRAGGASGSRQIRAFSLAAVAGGSVIVDQRLLESLGKPAFVVVGAPRAIADEEQVDVRAGEGVDGVRGLFRVQVGR